MTGDALAFLDIPGCWRGTEEQRAELLDPWETALHNATGADRVRARYAEQLEDTGETERRIASDYTGRFAIELLQNAQDACADANTTGRAWFRVSSTSLMVANEGIAFDPARIRSLTRLGGSSKRQRREGHHHTIGYKGIGFSAAFEVTDRPQIITDGLAFGFDRDRALDHVTDLLGTATDKVPGRYFPFFLTEEDWYDDREIVEELFAQGAVTVVRLPFRHGLDSDQISQTVQQSITASALLLMPSLSAISIDGVDWTKRKGLRIADAQVHHIRNGEDESESWLVSSGSTAIAASIVQALTEEVWHDVRTVNATVALPWRDGGIDLERPPQPAHVFFPTSDRLGRRLLVHGDFVLESNRKHIQSEGAGGRVTEVVADLAARLCAQLADQVCEARPALAEDVLRVLTPSSRTSGFGAELTEKLDEHLKGARFVPTTGGAVVAPQDAVTFDADVDPTQATALAALFALDRPLAVFSLDHKTRDYLVELDADRASHTELVSWFDPNLGQSYGRVVLAVKAWDATDGWRPADWLRKLPFLQSDIGHWRRPVDLITPVEGVPALPAGLTRETYSPPSHADAATFVEERCEPDALTLEAATALVFEEVRAGRYGQTDEEAKAAFEFIRRVWRRDKTIVRAMPKDVLPVPARAWRRGSRRVWSPAGKVYFSATWQGNNDLELVYRKTEALFLDEDPPARGKTDRRAFYRALGVADRPRRVAISASDGPWQWRSEVRWTFDCPEGHKQSGRAFECESIQDLAAILEDIDRATASALARLLAASDSPYGGDARARCTNSSHRKRVWRDAIGLQRWLLDRAAWIPVSGDGGNGLARPGESWTHVNSNGLRAVLSTVDLPVKLADKLDLPSATSPRPEHIVRAMERLADEHQHLDDVPPVVREGLEELLQKLEVSLKRRTSYELPVVALPVLRAGSYVWDEAPRIPDVPVASQLPVAVLPEGHWQNLARAADLTPLSAETSTKADFTDLHDDLGASLHLDPAGRTALTAILHVRGGHDLQELAANIGRLQVCSASQIDVEYHHQPTGTRARRSVHAHLDWIDDATPRLSALRDLPDEALQVVVAAELGRLVGNQAELEILLFLTTGPAAAKMLGVASAALGEAEAALARYRELLPEDPPTTKARQQAQTDEGQPTNQVQDGPAGDDDDDTSTTSPAEATPSDAEKQDIPGRGRGAASPPADAIRTSWSTPPSTGPEDDFDIDSVEFQERDLAPDEVRPSAARSDKDKDKSTRPSGARGGSGRSGYPSLSTEERQLAESRAVDIAKRLATERFGCVAVRDVQDDNLGWDLEFDFGGDRWWPVEVKGFGGAVESFIITRNERRAAGEESEYRLLLIGGTRVGSGPVITLRPGPWLTEAELEPMSWHVREWGEGIDRTLSWGT